VTSFPSTTSAAVDPASPPGDEGTRALLTTDDVLVREGSRIALVATGLSLSCAPLTGMEAADVHYDYAVVHLTPARALDRWSATRYLAALAGGRQVTTTIATLGAAPSRLLRLRLVEAGCTYLVPYDRLASAPAEFAARLVGAGLDDRWRLPTQWALRERLGLRWDGTVEPFLDAALKLPPQVWTTDLPQSALPASRAELRHVQRLARDVAGLPEPDFRRYASSVRRPPELPEWPAVRALVRGLAGIRLQRDSTARPTAQGHGAAAVGR
jgi:hypothetical protein